MRSHAQVWLWYARGEHYNPQTTGSQWIHATRCQIVRHIIISPILQDFQRSCRIRLPLHREANLMKHSHDGFSFFSSSPHLLTSTLWLQIPYKWPTKYLPRNMPIVKPQENTVKHDMGWYRDKKCCQALDLYPFNVKPLKHCKKKKKLLDLIFL